MMRRLAASLSFPIGLEDKASACNVGDLGSIPGSGRSSGEGNSNPLQYPCPENPRDRGPRWATVHVIAKSRTRLNDFAFTSYTSLLHGVYLFLSLTYFWIWILEAPSTRKHTVPC